ncbi:MAG: hypothetical protein ACOX2N_08475 [Peptococcia bacterium]|jgi:hypothetical protein
MKKMMIKGKKRVASVEFQKKVMSVFFAVLFMVILMSAPAFAVNSPAGTDKLDTVVDWLAEWAGRIGLVVAFFGALQTVLGFMNDDADSKVRGLKTLAAGFMVWGISESVDLLFRTQNP